MNSVTKHYDTLFAEVVSTFGALRSEIISAVIGFGAGGPVSVAVVDGKPVYVTCELSLYPEQLPSIEGERFELLIESSLNQSEIQDLLTALGRLSFNAQLGDGHTIDISGISLPRAEVSFTSTLHVYLNSIWPIRHLPNQHIAYCPTYQSNRALLPLGR